MVKKYAWNEKCVIPGNNLGHMMFLENNFADGYENRPQDQGPSPSQYDGQERTNHGILPSRITIFLVRVDTRVLAAKSVPIKM